MNSLVVPKKIDGMPVDVIQSNPRLERLPFVQRIKPLIERLPFVQRIKPLMGGMEIANSSRAIGPGTLGLVAVDGNLPTNLVGLTCHHVLVGSTGMRGDNVSQPGIFNTKDVIGTVSRFSSDLDCALCALNTARQVSRAIVGYPSGATSVQEPIIGMRVTKSGSASRITFGVIDAVSADEFTIVPDPDNPMPNEEISLPGDSGAAWLRVSDIAAIGLHYAGEPDVDFAAERAYAKRMSSVVRVLNIRLLDPSQTADLTRFRE